MKVDATLEKVELKARFGGEKTVKRGKLSPEEIQRIIAKFVSEANKNWSLKNYPYHLAIEPVFYGDTKHYRILYELEVTYTKLPVSMEEWADWQEKAKDLLSAAVAQLLDMLDFARKQKWLLEAIAGGDEE